VRVGLNIHKIFILFIILLSFAVSAAKAQSQDVSSHNRALSITKKLLAINKAKRIEPPRVSSEYDTRIIDLIFSGNEDQIVQKMDDVKAQSLFADYYSSYINLTSSRDENFMKSIEYKKIAKGLEADSWYETHIASLLLAFIHIKNDDPANGLYHAENVLSVIPPSDRDKHDDARHNAQRVLYMAFILNGDIDGAMNAIDKLILLSKKTKRQFDIISLINNLAVAFDKNGATETATRLTSLLVRRVKNDTPYNKLVANMSHGHFLLKNEQPKKAIPFLERAVKLDKRGQYAFFLNVDLAKAKAKVGDIQQAQFILTHINGFKKLKPTDVKYLDKRIYETKAIISAANGEYERAYNFQKRHTNNQIDYYKSGLSEDRRQANRRVLLSQEIAAKNLEQAELQLQLDREILAKQRARNRLYLALLMIGAMGAVAAVIVLRRLGVLNKKLKLANAEVEEKSKIKTELLAMFSHEMLTPLNGIVPLADILHRGETDPKKKKLLKMIELSGAELSQKMKDIVLVANPQDQSCEPVSVNVKSFLHETLLQFHHQALDGVELKVQMGKTLAETLRFDVERVRAAIYALLSNSLKHTDHGEVVLSLYMNDLGQAIIEVSDTGEGIPAERLEDMIKPFGQASLSITRANQGLGLGLTIVRLQCLIIGADFHMESTLGRGTSVRLTLPPCARAEETPHLVA
jgi:signal transduction histidine kinase